MLYVQVYDLKSGFKKTITKWCTKFSRQVIEEEDCWEREGRVDTGQNFESSRELGGICCSLHCTHGHKLHTASCTSEKPSVTAFYWVITKHWK